MRCLLRTSSTILVAVLICLAAESEAKAADYDYKWSSNGSVNWATYVWASTTGATGYPNAAGADVRFQGSNAAGIMTLDSPSTIGKLTYAVAGDGDITLAGTNSLTLDNNGSAVVWTLQGNQSGDCYSNPSILLNDDLLLNVKDGDEGLHEMYIDGPISDGDGAHGVKIKGTGLAYLRGANGYTGNTGGQGQSPISHCLVPASKAGTGTSSACGLWASEPPSSTRRVCDGWMPS